MSMLEKTPEQKAWLAWFVENEKAKTEKRKTLFALLVKARECERAGNPGVLEIKQDYENEWAKYLELAGNEATSKSDILYKFHLQNELEAAIRDGADEGLIGNIGKSLIAAGF